MKILLSITLLLLLSFVSFGQTFSLEWEKVPATFKGHDAEAIHTTLLTSGNLKEKGEFETTAQFNERINNPSSLSLGNGLSANDLLVFVYTPTGNSSDGFTSKYNADQEAFDVEIKTKKVSAIIRSAQSESRLVSVFATAILPLTLTNRGTYTASNSFGNQREVTRYLASQFSLAINNISYFKEKKGSYLGSNLHTSVYVPIAEAKSAKENLSALFVTKLTAPYFTVDGFTVKPTLDNPKEIQSYNSVLIGDVSEIWIFNRATGQIYKKLKATLQAQ